MSGHIRDVFLSEAVSLFISGWLLYQSSNTVVPKLRGEDILQWKQKH